VSPAWAVAVAIVALLVCVLTVVVLRMLGLIRNLEVTANHQSRIIASLRVGANPAPAAQTPEAHRPSQLLLVLESDDPAAVELALDLRASGRPTLDVEVRALVDDSAAGRALADNLPYSVEFEQRTGNSAASTGDETPNSTAFSMPHALMLNNHSHVLTKNRPHNVAELQSLMQSATS